MLSVSLNKTFPYFLSTNRTTHTKSFWNTSRWALAGKTQPQNGNTNVVNPAMHHHPSMSVKLVKQTQFFRISNILCSLPLKNRVASVQLQAIIIFDHYFFYKSFISILNIIYINIYISQMDINKQYIEFLNNKNWIKIKKE